MTGRVGRMGRYVDRRQKCRRDFRRSGPLVTPLVRHADHRCRLRTDEDEPRGDRMGPFVVGEDVANPVLEVGGLRDGLTHHAGSIRNELDQFLQLVLQRDRACSARRGCRTRHSTGKIDRAGTRAREHIRMPRQPRRRSIGRRPTLLAEGRQRDRSGSCRSYEGARRLSLPERSDRRRRRRSDERAATGCQPRIDSPGRAFASSASATGDMPVPRNV